MKKLWLLGALVALTLNAQQVLKLGTDPTFAPYESKTPSGEIVGFRLTLAADPAKGASTGEGVRQDMVIPGATLAAALILYCRDRNIPLAASAGKSLQLFGNQVCLVTTMNPGPGERAQAAAP